MKRLLFVFLILFLLVGIANADTLIVTVSENSQVGRYYSAGQTLANIISGAGTSDQFNRTTGYGFNTIETKTTNYDVINRGLMSVNLSTIPVGSTIIDVKLTVYGYKEGGTATTFKANAVISNASPANPYLHAYTDYNTSINVKMSDTIIDQNNWGSAGTMNNWTFNINGTTYFNSRIGTNASVMMRSTTDFNGVLDGIFQASKYTDCAFYLSGTKPFFTITYTPPDTTPPASITNLANTTTYNSANFTWTNPADADFNGIQYWFNGTLQSPNLSNTTTYKLFTGLMPNTNYTFSTKTFDNATPPNVNASFVNMTATTSWCAPATGFSANETSGTSPLSVGFTDASTNTPTDWDWYFWDNETKSSDLQHPEQVFTTGLYNIRLYAANSGGGDWENKTGYINVSAGGSAPVASFTKNQTSGLQPLIVQFNDTSTNIPTVWNWSFGDGIWQNGTTQNATYTYPSGGTYSPFLISSNAYGSNQSASQTINIYNQTSGTTITPSPASGQTNTAIPLTPSGVNVSANGYSWYFPNGSSIINTTSAPINFIGTVDGGTYSVQLTTTDNGWGASSVNVTVTTEDNTAANFTANITSGLTPLPVLFTDSSTHIPIRFNWSFGDGSAWVNGTDPTPTHIYATGGEYTVILVASNLLSTDTKTRTNYIEVWNRTGIASFNADIVTGDAPLSVTFTDVSYNATNWYTEFGDGNTSTTKSPAFVYNIPGLYTVNHRAYNAHDSAWLNQTDYINVTTPIPVAAFSGVPTTGDAPLSVTFTDASTNAPTSWYWEFGDGNTSTAQNPSNDYGTPGLYSVNLKATNAGGSDWENKTNYINVTAAYVPAPPVAAFTGVPTSGSAPLLVTFTDASTNTPLSWYWEFGDGNTSTLKNPTKTYGTPGTYSVNLRATNADGFDWENKTNYITANVPPTPTPTPTPIPMTPNLNRDARIVDPLTWIKNWFNDIRHVEQ